MICNNLKTLYDELFGEDDEEDDVPARHAPSSDHEASGVCMPVDSPQGASLVEQGFAHDAQLIGPPGLALYKQWAELLQAISTEGWCKGAANQAMCFGKLPEWIIRLIDAMPLKGWPHQTRSRDPVFDQMIVNSYKPGEGIISHVDLLKFGDGIAIISLGAPATMTFTKVQGACEAEHADGQACTQQSQRQQTSNDDRDQMPAFDLSAASQSLHQDVFLEPGDLLLLHREARYTWKHGIANYPSCEAEDAPNRVSITLRKLV